MLLRDPNITIRLNVDFFAARAAGKLPEHGLLVYTGPIDSYFAQQGMPRLEYRSLRFEEARRRRLTAATLPSHGAERRDPKAQARHHLVEIPPRSCRGLTATWLLLVLQEWVPEPPDGFFQEAMVVNYPSPDVKFTRIVEYKHVPNQPEAVKRGDVKGTLLARETSSAEGDPYYPVPNPANNDLYEKYRGARLKRAREL